jgi:predicted nuclease with TOPRIM domain
MAAKKMKKQERLIKLRSLLEAFKKSGQEPDVSKLAQSLECVRQTLYYDKDYRALLEEYQVGQQFREKKVVSKEYLLQRIEDNENEIKKSKSKIEKLHTKVAELEDDNKNLIIEITQKEKRFLRLSSWYCDLIDEYNRISGTLKSIEPFDIHKLDHDPLTTNTNRNNTLNDSNVVHLQKNNSPASN